jgi:hypothetical protein
MNLFLHTFFFLLKNGADPNQTESEHHLTPIHVLCDAEYHGQSLRVNRIYFRLIFQEFIILAKRSS